MTPNSTTIDAHPGMMGDGTEEQNLGQRGNPDARISQDEVEEAFASRRPAEQRSFDEDDGGDRWSSLRERGDAIRDHVASSAEAVREWASAKADLARQTAADKPVLVVSLSAGVALAAGLAIGFVLGRASDDYYD
jgi:hypothetical protein